ncbi:MAG TPA: solute carrier family 23 protein [Verrucomicrobiota bacterium]|nr:solute carrier family 23 protein [Verrucomicrobiota bacterium]
MAEITEQPKDLIYGLADRPPLTSFLLLGFQHAAVICPYLVMTALVAQAAGEPFAVAHASMGMAMLGIAAMTLLQAVRSRHFGSGYFCPPVISAIYLPAALAAAHVGGLALSAGMTLVAGMFEAAFSRLVRVLRKIFPAVVSGVILLAVGLQLGRLGMEIVFDAKLLTSHRLGPVAWTALGTLAPMIALGVWGKGLPRLLGPLIGIVTGYLVAIPLGQIELANLASVGSAPWVALPSLRLAGLAFDPQLIAPFFIAGLASGLRSVGVVTTCQQINDAAWRRPDLRNIESGVLADGVGGGLCGWLCGMGASTSPSLVGIQKTTGATSRVLAWSVAGWLVVLACLPKFTALIVGMPKPVMGAALFFNGALMLVAGIQIAVSRPVTFRETLVIGISFLLASGVLIFGDFFGDLPAGWRPVFGSPLSVAVIAATGLNLVFLVGRWRYRSLRLAPGQELSPRQLDDFLTGRAKEWKLRADDLERILATTRDALEHIGPTATDFILIETGFDDFDVSVLFKYRGALPTLAGNARPQREMVDEQSFVIGLSGCLAGVAADRIQSSVDGDMCQVRLLFRI